MDTVTRGELYTGTCGLRPLGQLSAKRKGERRASALHGTSGLERTSREREVNKRLSLLQKARY